MSLQQLLNQDILIYPKSSFDAYGREVTDTGVNYKARFQKVSKSRLTPTGQTITIDAICYLNGEPTVAQNDKLTIDSVSYKVLGVETSVDGQGNTYMTKLMLQNWNQG